MTPGLCANRYILRHGLIFRLDGFEWIGPNLEIAKGRFFLTAETDLQGRPAIFQKISSEEIAMKCKVQHEVKGVIFALFREGGPGKPDQIKVLVGIRNNLGLDSVVQ